MIWPRIPKYTGPERRKKPRRKIRRLPTLLALLALSVIGYGIAVVWLLAEETRMVFQAVQTLGETRPPFPYEHVDLPRKDGRRQFAWVMRRDASPGLPWVIYLHGSPSTLASPVNISHYGLLRDLGLNVIAPEYRGFGGLDGTPSEGRLLVDARTAYDYLRERERAAPRAIVLYGWSLGAAVAVDLASEVEAGAVIVEGAPASIADLNQQRYPLFPIRFLMRSRFDSIPKVGRVSEPLLFLHSPQDTLVPIADARRLFDVAPGPKTFVEVSGGHVEASEADSARFAGAVRTFLEAHGVLPASR